MQIVINNCLHLCPSCKRLASKPILVFKTHEGMLRTVEALRARHPSPHALRATEQGARSNRSHAVCSGSPHLPPLGEPDLVIVAKKVPQAVFCLLTALAFHRLTTHVPHTVAIALVRTARVPRLGHPPLEVFRFSPASL